MQNKGIEAYVDGDYVKAKNTSLGADDGIAIAMGMAQESGKPVVCLCTAGTAVCNYIPGITEAFYQNVPVIAITSDQHPFLMDQQLLWINMVTDSTPGLALGMEKAER